jgi:hypothetical protein
MVYIIMTKSFPHNGHHKYFIVIIYYHRHHQRYHHRIVSLLSTRDCLNSIHIISQYQFQNDKICPTRIPIPTTAIRLPAYINGNAENLKLKRYTAF